MNEAEFDDIVSSEQERNRLQESGKMSRHKELMQISTTCLGGTIS